MSEKCYLCGSTDGKCNHFPTPPASHDAGEAAVLDTGNLSDDTLYWALDRLYERGWLDKHKENDYDPRGTQEWQHTLDLFRAFRATLTAEVEKETAHSKHLAGAVSRKIEELIATENQCGYYRTQYTRCEQVRKEACEANVKAQAAMLWLEADLERSRQECEGLREVLHTALEALRHSRPWDAGDAIKAALSEGEKI